MIWPVSLFGGMGLRREVFEGFGGLTVLWFTEYSEKVHGSKVLRFGLGPLTAISTSSVYVPRYLLVVVCC